MVVMCVSSEGERLGKVQERGAKGGIVHLCDDPLG